MMFRPLLVFAVTASAAAAQPAQDLPGPKITWPEIDGLTKIVEVSPKAGSGYTVIYTVKGFKAEATVYNRGLKKIPDGPDSPEVRDQVKNMADGLERIRKQGFYTSVKELGTEETVRLGGPDGPQALRRRFEVEKKAGGTQVIEFYCTGFKDHFLFLRIDLVEPNSKDAPARTAAVLGAVGKAIK
jgi:hypothetical protein